MIFTRRVFLQPVMCIKPPQATSTAHQPSQRARNLPVMSAFLHKNEGFSAKYFAFSQNIHTFAVPNQKGKPN